MTFTLSACAAMAAARSNPSLVPSLLATFPGLEDLAADTLAGNGWLGARKSLPPKTILSLLLQDEPDIRAEWWKPCNPHAARDARWYVFLELGALKVSVFMRRLPDEGQDFVVVPDGHRVVHLYGSEPVVQALRILSDPRCAPIALAWVSAWNRGRNPMPVRIRNDRETVIRLAEEALNR